MVSNKEIKRRLNEKRNLKKESIELNEDRMGYLVCEKCNGYYKLQKGENPNRFSDKCKCNGKLKYFENIEDFIQENQLLVKKFNKIKEENFDLRKAQSDLIKKNDILEKEKSELQEHYSNYYGFYNNLSYEKSAWEESFTNLKQLEEKTKSENLKFKMINNKLTDECSKLEVDNSNLRSKYHSIKENLSKLNAFNSNLRNEYRLLKEKYSKLEVENKDIYKLKTENNDLRDEYLKLKVELSNLTTDYNDKSSSTLLIPQKRLEGKKHKEIGPHQKMCDECKKILSKSEFYKTDSSPDGYSNICKYCKRNKNAAAGLQKLLKYIELNIPFKISQLTKMIQEDSFSINYIYVLQELDLLTYREDSEDYILRSSTKLEDFCEKYTISPAK